MSSSNTVKNVAIVGAIAGAGFLIWKGWSSIKKLLAPLGLVSTIAGDAAVIGGKVVSGAEKLGQAMWGAISAPFAGCTAFAPNIAYLSSDGAKTFRDGTATWGNAAAAMTTWAVTAAMTGEDVRDVMGHAGMKTSYSTPRAKQLFLTDLANAGATHEAMASEIFSCSDNLTPEQHRLTLLNLITAYDDWYTAATGVNPRDHRTAA